MAFYHRVVSCPSCGQGTMKSVSPAADECSAGCGHADHYPSAYPDDRDENRERETRFEDRRDR